VDDRSLSVTILAGGRSSRMGRDKATIEIDGIPMIRRIYDVVAGCRDRSGVMLGSSERIYVVTSWPQRYQPILPTTCGFIAERSPDCGPLVAFSQALAEITSEWVFLIACDLPNLSTPAIQSWIDALPSIPAESIAYLAKHADRGWEPLCGFYRQNCHRDLLAYIDRGGRSFQGWLNRQVVTELVVTDPTWLFNCNTPEDLVDTRREAIDLK
jgi:molybdenum cofactor guanylyltransferase